MKFKKAFMKAKKGTLISCSCEIDFDIQLTPDLIIRTQELQTKIYVQPHRPSIENSESLQKKCEMLRYEM